MAFKIVVLFLAVVTPVVWSYSAGAPPEACGDMTPQHHVDPQSSPAPYNIMISKAKIKSGEAVEITIHGKSNKDTIKGLLVQARVGNTAIGKFDIAPSNAYIQAVSCGSGHNNAITHKKIQGAGPNSLSFTWVAPAGLSEKVVFQATIALNGGVFWVGHKSAPLSVN